MRNRISLYLLRQLLTATVFAVLAVTLIIWLTQSLRLIQLVIDRGASFWTFGKLMLLTLPTFLPLVYPFGLAAGIMFVYVRQIQESELIVMRAAGLSQMQLAKPALFLAGLSVGLLLLFTAWISPWATHKLVGAQYLLRNDISVLLLRDGTFTTLSDGLTVYVRERGDAGDMRGLLVQDNRKPDHPMTIIADRGIVSTDKNGGAKAIAFNGTRQEFNRKTGHLSQLDFDNYTIDLSSLNPSALDRWAEPRERTLFNLFAPPEPNLPPDLMARIRSEFHQRLTISFLAPAFSMIVLTILLLSPFDRRGMSKRIAAGALTIAAMQGLVMSVGNIAVRHPPALVLIYLLTLSPICIGAWLLVRGPSLGFRRRSTTGAAA